MLNTQNAADAIRARLLQVCFVGVGGHVTYDGGDGGMGGRGNVDVLCVFSRLVSHDSESGKGTLFNILFLSY